MLRLLAERGFPQRRACELIRIDPKTVRREPDRATAICGPLRMTSHAIFEWTGRTDA